MSEKNLKIVISVVIVCFIYFIIIFVYMMNNKTTKGYIINSNLGGFYCKQKKCEFVSQSDIKINNSYALFQYGEYVGDYTPSLVVDKWNFKQNEDYESIYGDFLAIDEKLNYQYIPIKTEALNTDDILLLQKTTQINFSKLNNSYKIAVDLDNNGVTDYIYTLSNQVDDGASSEYFSIFYVSLNGELLTIYNDKNKDADNYELPFYSVAGIVNIDSIPKIIINKTYYSNMGESSTMIFTVLKSGIKNDAEK